MKNFFKSLTFKIGSMIILVEIIVLAVTGFFYINRFSAQVDERIRTRIEIPGKLIKRGLLSFGSVADEVVMTEVVGEGLLEGMVVGADKKVYHSLDSAYAQKVITDVLGVELDWFDEDLTESLLMETADDLVSITPIKTFAEEKSSFFIYIKVGTAHAEREKGAIFGLFVLGSIFSVLITSIAIILLFNSTILTRIKGLLVVLRRVESGDLTARIDSTISPDEMGTLQGGVNSMATRLAKTVDSLERRVDELRLAETALRRSEERYRGLFEDSPISLWEEDFSAVKQHLDKLRSEGIEDFRTYFEDHPEAVTQCAAKVKIIDINRSTVELFGAKSKEELIGELGQIFDKETFNRFKKELLTIVDGQTWLEYESINHTLAGDKRHTALTWSVAPGYEETLSKVLISIIDVTERRQAEEALAQERNLLRTLIDNLPDFIFVKDTQSRFVINNIAHVHGMGAATQEELFGKTDFDMFPPDLAAQFYANEQTVIRSGELLVNQEEPFIDTAGHQRWLSTTKVPLRDSHDEIMGLVGMSRDITAHKQAEEELKRYRDHLEELVAKRTQALKEKNEDLEKTLQKLQEAQNRLVAQEKLASLGALTAGIAHEIKNPLNFVINFAAMSIELAQEVGEEIKTQKDRLKPETIKDIDDILSDLESNAARINEHGTRADSIVRSMLLHSRGKAGERQLTDLNALLAEDVNLAYHGMRARDAAFDINIETAYDPSLKPVEVVPQDISRVFINIINNACDATREKKKVLGEAFSPILSVGTKNLANQVEIRIRDNGCGISPEVRNKIFNPFFTTKLEGKGTGLGLSISYDIITHEHQGEIDLDTEVDNYTEFIISLPK